MYLNKVFIIGNLTRDPELKALPSGSKVCNLGVATNRTFKDKDGSKQEMVEFHNVSAFNKLGELANQYMKKGRQIFVEGRLQTRSWDGADGQKRYRTEVIAENIQFGNFPSGASAPRGEPETAGKSDGAAPAVDAGDSAASSGKIDYPQEEINPDDIPF